MFNPEAPRKMEIDFSSGRQDPEAEAVEEHTFHKVTISALADYHLASLWKDHSTLWGLICDNHKVMAMVCNAWARRLTEWYGVDRIGFLECRHIGSADDWSCRGGPRAIADAITERFSLVFLLYLDAVREWQTIPLMNELFSLLLEKSAVVGCCTTAFESELESWIKSSGKDRWAIVSLSGHSHQASIGSKKWEEQAVVDAKVRANKGTGDADRRGMPAVACASDEDVSLAVSRISESATSQEEFLAAFTAVVDSIPDDAGEELSREMKETISIFRALVAEGEMREAFLLACSFEKFNY
jgi:hypothetical protein